MSILSNIVIYVTNFSYNYHIINKIYKIIVITVSNQAIYHYQDIDYIKLFILQT